MANNPGSIPSDIIQFHPTQMNCVYAISGAYGFLPRLLYYVTLIFAIFGRSREWLIIGALVSALTYSGTSAIHQMALANSKNEIYDLDIIGAWAILSTGALGYIAMMHWSSTLRSSKARWVMVGWGILVGVALIFGRTELFDNHLSEPESACYSSNGTLLEYPIQLISPDFNCTYKCFSVRKVMRQAGEVMVVPRELLENKYTRLSYVLVGPIQFAAYAALSWDRSKHTPSQLCTRLVMRYLNPKHHEDIVKLIYNASSERWYGGYFVLFRFVSKSKWSGRKALIAFFTIPWFLLELIIDVLALPMMIVNIVLNELSIMKTHLPTNEANYAIGQWGPLVSATLVVMAATFNKYMEFRERQRQNRKEMEEDDAATVIDSVDDDFDIGKMEEQTIGIVKPGLAHVQTLRDMEELRNKK